MNSPKLQTQFKKYVCVFAFITILPYGIGWLRNSIFADESRTQILQVSPFLFTLNLSPDTEYIYEISLSNLQDFPVGVTITKDDFTVHEDTGDVILEENNGNSLLSWIDIEETDMIIDPSQTRRVQFKITTPEKIPFGGYHGMLFLEPRFGPVEDDSSILSTRIGVPVIAGIGSSPYQVSPLTVSDFNFSIIAGSINDLDYTFRVKNNSLFHTSTQPVLLFKPLVGEHKKLHLEEKLIFPGKSRQWTEKTISSDKLSPNFYRVTLVIPTGNGNSISTSSYLLLVPWAILTILLFILSSFVAVVIYVYKSRHLRLKMDSNVN